LIDLSSVRKWIIRTLEDPIGEILLKNSHFTKIQLETLLIDILAEENAEKPIKYEEKVKLRLKKGGISRGSFNRTLKQARRNVIRTVYSILLLGYLGFLDNPQMEVFIEASHRLQTYMDAYQEVWERYTSGKASEEDLKAIELMKAQLTEQLESLAKPKMLARKA
jgi:hypothetical protein